MEGVRIQEEMKRDAFGVVERVVVEGPAYSSGDGSADAPVELVRRVLVGPRLLRPVARLLARREQRALTAIAGIAVPSATALGDEREAALRSLATTRGEMPRPADVFLRPFAPGRPLHRADELPRDFFDLLEVEVRALHAVGVCHNDLHKEQNVVVGPTGRPTLIDFQLASVHPTHAGRTFTSRCRDDLRHVQKLRRRYTKDGRGPAELGVPDEERVPRRGVALLWRRTGKPLYRFVTRGLLRTRDGEERRPSAGPWPRWTDPVGPHEKTARGA